MCFCVYITLPPPPASCPAPLTASACNRIMCIYVRSQSQSATRWCVSASLDAIDVVGAVSCANCYVISRHTESMMWWVGFWNCHCVAMPMHLFSTTYRWQVQCWTTPPEQHGCSPFVLLQDGWASSCDIRVSRTSFRITCYSCNRTGNGRRRGWHITSWRIMERPTLISLIFLTVYI